MEDFEKSKNKLLKSINKGTLQDVREFWGNEIITKSLDISDMVDRGKVGEDEFKKMILSIALSANQYKLYLDAEIEREGSEGVEESEDI